MKLRKAVSAMLCSCMLAGIFIPQAQPVSAAEQTNFSNLVLFVDFPDADHSTHAKNLWGECFLGDPEVTFQRFDGDAAHPRGMSWYLSEISYGQLNVENILPQYDGTGILPYRTQYNSDHYVGSLGGEGELIREVLQQLTLPEGTRLDRNGDGAVDNLTIVLPYVPGVTDSVNCHKGNYGGGDTLGGAVVNCYNVLKEELVYLGLNSSGVIIHEFLHTLGYPDLYVQNVPSGGTCSPVGAWDIMSGTTMYVQYPLAYFRSAVTRWFNIPTVTASQTGYSLYAASAASAADRDSQAVILKTDYSDTEFFVLEYRKKGAAYSEEYDCKIPGSGLIVYRINKACDGNINGAPYLAYVYRPGDSCQDGRELAVGSMESSFLSAESGRTRCGCDDLNASLADGAITYSDGTNSGIIISNVGSASEDQISFDITFTPLPNTDYWKTAAAQPVEDISTSIASWRDADGTVYYLQEKMYGSRSVYLYRCDPSGWSRCGSPLTSGGAYYPQLVRYGGTLFAAYSDGEQARLARWTGTAWETVYTSPVTVGEVALAADDSGLYLAYTSGDFSQISVCRYAEGSIEPLGTAAEGGYLSNLSLGAEGGAVAVMYREFLSGNRITVKALDSNGWRTVGRQSMSANSAMCTVHDGAVYLMKNGSIFGENKSFLYRCELSSAEADWTQMGESFFADEPLVEMDLCFMGERPYIVYQGGSTMQVHAVGLEQGRWAPVGRRVAGEIVSGLKVCAEGGTLYVTYLSSSSGRTYIKSAQVSAPVEEPEIPPETPDVPPEKPEGPPEKPGPSSGGGGTSSEGSGTSSGGSGSSPEGSGTSPVEPGIPFIDVDEDSYYYDAVRWAINVAVTEGVDGSHFAPEQVCTRAQVVTFLWRAEGCPEPSGSNPFVDVQTASWYEKAVRWAAEEGITTGVDPTHFLPEEPVTRSQFVTFLWRLAERPAHSGQNPFSDLGSPSEYYYDAVLWACEKGITNGAGGGRFLPEEICTRGQTVTFLWRYSGKPDPSGRDN